jgi:WD40 repeat protein
VCNTVLQSTFGVHGTCVRAYGNLISFINFVQGHEAEIKGVALSPDGRQIASASANGTIRVWDLATGQCSITLQVSVTDYPIKTGVQSVSSTTLWPRSSTSSLDQNIIIHPFPIQGHQGVINAIVFTADGRQLVSGGNDKNVCLWDLASGQLVKTLEVRSFVIRCQSAINAYECIADILHTSKPYLKGTLF